MVTNKTPGDQCALKQQCLYNTNDLVRLHVYFLIALVLNRLGRKTNQIPQGWYNSLLKMFVIRV